MLLETKLKQKGLIKLKESIYKNNIRNNIFYEILGINNSINYSNLKINGINYINTGDLINNFNLTGSLNITAFIYNTEKVLNKISVITKKTLLKNTEKFLFINKNSLRILNVIYKKNNPFEMKATAQAEVFFSYNFTESKNNFLGLLKNKIKGLNKEDAFKVLLNNPKISDVEIKIRPFFVNTISKINDNIIIKIIDI